MEVPTDNKRFKYSGMSAGPAPEMDVEALKEWAKEREEMFQSIRDAAAVGNASFEYFEKHGEFPTKREQLKVRKLS
jgi:hypothetical protein